MSAFDSRVQLERVADNHARHYLTQQTHAHRMFLSRDNLTKCRQFVEQTLSKETGIKVIVPVTNDFVVDAQHVAGNTQVSDYKIYNSMFIDHLLDLHRASIVHERLWYERDVLDKRPKVAPRGEASHHVRGEVQLDASGWQLADPLGQRFEHYMAEWENA